MKLLAGSRRLKSILGGELEVGALTAVSYYSLRRSGKHARRSQEEKDPEAASLRMEEDVAGGEAMEVVMVIVVGEVKLGRAALGNVTRVT